MARSTSKQPAGKKAASKAAKAAAKTAAKAPPASASRDLVRATVPKLIDLTEKVVYGDVWERAELSKRDRSLITVAALVAMNREEQLRGHMGRALDNGVTRAEIAELVTHLAFYSGWPTAMSAARVAKDVFEKKDKE